MRLRILFVEDSEDDVELMLRRLRDAGLDPLWDRVATEADLRAALADAAWDIALVDFNLPGFGGPQALAVVGEAAPDTPALTVSGAIDEDTAVITLTAGAVDYVLKDNLARLAPAVRRAVEGADLRRRHRVAADSARRALFATDSAPIAAVTVAADGTIVYANAAQGRLRGVPADEQVGQKIWESNLGLSPAWWQAVTEAVDRAGSYEDEATVRRPDGQARLIDVMFGAIDHEGTRYYVGWARDITARREAERRARESEEIYRRIVEMAAEGIWVTDAEHTTTFVNEQMAQMLGYTAAEMIGKGMAEFLFPEDVEILAAEMRRRAEGQSGYYIGRLRRRDGGEVWISASSVAQVGPDGEALGSFGMFTDVTERRLAEQALRVEEANLAAIFESSPVAMLVLDEALSVVRVNPAALKLAGGCDDDLLEFCTGSQLKCGPALACVHRDDDPRGCGYSESCPLCPLRNALEALIAEGAPVHGAEMAVDLSVDGRVRTVWLRVGAQAVVMNGAPHVVVALDDVSDGRLAEQALRESEARYRAMFEGNRAIKLLIDPETAVIVDANPAAVDFYGYRREQIVGMKMWEIDTLPEDEVRTAVRRAAAQEVSSYVFRHRLAGGDMRDVHLYSGPLQIEGRTLLLSIIYDVSEQVRAEAALRESERRFVEFAEHLPGELWIRDDQRHYLYVNPRLAQDLGKDPAEMLGTLPSDVWDPENAARIRALDERVARGEVVDDLSQWVTREGPLVYRSVYFPIPREGAPALLGGISFDVTEEYEAQAEILRHAARLRRTVEGAVLAMGHVVETRDPYTAGHERRVAELAVAVAHELGLEAPAVEGLRLAALIHDIGKIAVPAEILAKPGRLSEVEFNLIRQHARAGYEILADIDFDAPVAEIVLQHHERLDGSGYPQALSGEQILPEARVLALADVVEAMSSHRPYRPALGMEAALTEVREGAGKRYDAAVAAACLRVVEEQGFAFTP